MSVLGPWTLDASRFALVDTQQQRELEPLLFRLLQYFLLHPERVIGRQELADQVWQQAYVDDNAINRAISDLRKVLQHPLLEVSVLKTHHRKGYSLQWNAQLQQQFLAVSACATTIVSEPAERPEPAGHPQQLPDAVPSAAGQPQQNPVTPDTSGNSDNPYNPELRPRRYLLALANVLLLAVLSALWWFSKTSVSNDNQPVVPAGSSISAEPTLPGSAFSPPVQFSFEQGIATTPILSKELQHSRRLLAYSQAQTPRPSQVIVRLFDKNQPTTAEAVSLELAGYSLGAQNWQSGKAVLLVLATHQTTKACHYRLYDFTAYPAYQQQKLEAGCEPGSRVRAWLAADGQMLYRPQREPKLPSSHLIQEELATSQQQILVNSRGNGFGVLDFALSPDGNKLAYIQMDSSKSGFVYVYDLKKHEQVQLASITDIGTMMSLTFSQSGTHLYGMNGFELVQIRLADRRIQKLRLPAGFQGGELSLADDQSAVVSEVSVRMVARNGSMQVVELNNIFDKNQQKISWFLPENKSAAAVTPYPTDPQRFAYAAFDGQSWQVWLREAGQEQQLTELPPTTEPINHLSWSPDGQQLVFSSKKILWLYHVADRKLTQLHPLAEFLFPVFDPTGDSLLVQRDVDKQQQIWRLQIPSGQLQRVGLNQGAMPQFDQDQLYYNRGNQLMRYVDGGKADQVISADGGNLISTYRVSQGWVYYFVHEKSEFRRFQLQKPEVVESVSLQQLQLESKGMPITLSLQTSRPEQLFVNMMIYQQMHLHLLQWQPIPE